jgi:hypothetical protein
VTVSGDDHSPERKRIYVAAAKPLSAAEVGSLAPTLGCCFFTDTTCLMRRRRSVDNEKTERYAGAVLRAESLFDRSVEEAAASGASLDHHDPRRISTR